MNFLASFPILCYSDEVELNYAIARSKRNSSSIILLILLVSTYFQDYFSLRYFLLLYGFSEGYLFLAYYFAKQAAKEKSLPAVNRGALYIGIFFGLIYLLLCFAVTQLLDYYQLLQIEAFPNIKMHNLFVAFTAWFWKFFTCCLNLDVKKKPKLKKRYKLE